MEDRQVTHVRRNDDGDIMALCHPGEPWSPREKEDAIADVDHHRSRYYIVYGGERTNIYVVDDPGGRYLRTVADWTESDDLQSLPDCHEKEHATVC